MAHQSPIGNPFMLMMHPEVVLAAIENSERLGKLESRMCRPLDRQAPGATATDDAGSVDDEDTGPADAAA
jgi:hypothetical protein